MRDGDRLRLLFGPYHTPLFEYGDEALCEARGEVVIVGLTDARIPWPVGKQGRARSLVVHGGLADAVRRESAQAVAHSWGVTGQTVTVWRRALGVGAVTEGTRRLKRDHAQGPGVAAGPTTAGGGAGEARRADRGRWGVLPREDVLRVAPMLAVADLGRSAAFYRDRLGFEVLEEAPGLVLLGHGPALLYLVEESAPTPDKPGVWLAPPAPGGRTPVNLVLRVADCRAAYRRLSAEGVAFLSPPTQPPWGGWRCFGRDPDGYLVEIEQP